MAASTSLSRRPVGKPVVRLSNGAEKRRVRALSPYYETKTKAPLELGAAQISEERDREKEYPEYGEDEDMDESVNTDEVRESLARDDWLLSGQEPVEFTGGIYDAHIPFIFDVSIHSEESFLSLPRRKSSCRHENFLTKLSHEVRLLLQRIS